MISCRENLLVRPWQQRKYEHHKKKVLMATPVIDTKAPPHRAHVALKLKKLQKEGERLRKIERDNLILLQKLNYIMKTHWQDNHLAPQPTFLSRIGVYRALVGPKDLSVGVDLEIQEPPDEPLTAKPQCRKLKCLACSPLKPLESVQKPEERVPWEPAKKQLGTGRSRSVPPRRPQPLPTITEKPKSAFAKTEERPKPDASSSAEKRKSLPTHALVKHPNLILSRGALKLSLNFPSDTVVQFDQKRSQSKGDIFCVFRKNMTWIRDQPSHEKYTFQELNTLRHGC